MNKLFYTLMVMLSFVCASIAQRNKQEVIYLKNGSVIRNIQEMQHVDSLIQVRTADGSVFVFSPGDLLKMNYEQRNRRYKASGYLFNVEWGLLSGRQAIRSQFNTTRETSSVLTFSLVNGYRFNRFVGVGIGWGIDAYRDGVITPLFARGTGYLFNTRFSPIYALDVGYGFYSNIFNSKQENGTFIHHHRGGVMGNLAGGVQVFLGRDVSFYTMLGYRLQDYQYTVSSEWLQSKEAERILFRRMSLRIGFSF